VNFASKLTEKPHVSNIKNAYSSIETERLMMTWLLNNCNIKFNSNNINNSNTNTINNANSENNKSILLKYLKNADKYEHILASMYIGINYLKKILKAESFFPVCEVSLLNDFNSIKSSKMILDFLTISKLELLESKLDPFNPNIGSFNYLINKATTPFGKRKLTNWLLNPLLNKEKIEERYNSIEIISNEDGLFRKIEKILRELPDLERSVNRTYQFSITTSSKAVYFDNVSQKKLKDFLGLLAYLEKCVKILNLSNEFMNDVNNKDENNNLLSSFIINNENNEEITDGIEYLRSMLEKEDKDSSYFSNINTINNDPNIIRPRKGLNTSFDEIEEKLNKIKEKATTELNALKKQLNAKNNNDVVFTNNRHSPFEFL